MRIRSSRALRCLLTILLFTVGLAAVATGGPAQESDPPAPVGSEPQNRPDSAGRGKPPGRFAMPDWSFLLQGGFAHQFETGIDGGSRYQVNRFFLQGIGTYLVSPDLGVSLALGVGHDAYDFSGDGFFGTFEPWKNVRSMRVSVPVRWAMDEQKQWTLFVLPSVRAAGERGAKFRESIFGGGLAGVSYKVSDSLTLGPGFGYFTELEDDPTFFPIILIDWKIVESLNLRTGRGLAATRAPGLELTWKAAKAWTLALGGRYDDFSFRLNDDSPAPGGVGRERAWGGYVGAEFRPSRQMSIGALAIVSLGGELQLDDSRGERIQRQDHDPALSLALTFRLRF